MKTVVTTVTGETPRIAAPYSPPSEVPLIRRASIVDVPAIVRALPIPRAPEGISDSQMYRILRLTLTHVAIEHGAAWVALADDGEVVGSALAVPTWELDDDAELPELLARETELEPGPEPTIAPMSWLSGLGKVWLITHPVVGTGEVTNRLLETVVAETSQRARVDNVPLAIVAPTEQDRLAAERLGFTRVVVPDLGAAAWIGIRDPLQAHAGR